MIEIVEGQILEVERILSFKGTVKQADIEKIVKDMDDKIREAGAKRCQNPIMATYGMSGDSIELEILLPIDKEVSSIDKYVFKEKVRIVNAVKLMYKGNPMALQAACNELNTYILNHKLQPITVGYNVTKKVDMLNADNTEVDVYVGISPNIL